MKPNEHVILEIARERERQMEVEGYAAEYDDNHSCGELAQAAACYAYPSQKRVDPQSVPPPIPWPKSIAWWNPKDRRNNLVRAAALIVAEIERLDRLSKMEEKAP